MSTSEECGISVDVLCHHVHGEVYHGLGAREWCSVCSDCGVVRRLRANDAFARLSGREAFSSSLEA